MATHDVTMNLSHPITVMNVDVEFEVRADGELMGKVQISRGGIDWMPFKSHPRAATWEQFAAWMEGTAYARTGAGGRFRMLQKRVT